MRQAPAPLRVPLPLRRADDPVQSWSVSVALGVFIDTIVICSCTAMIMLLTPEEHHKRPYRAWICLQTSMQYHLGDVRRYIHRPYHGFLFSFSTFIGVLFYARSNVAYLFGDNWTSPDHLQGSGACDAVYRWSRRCILLSGIWVTWASDL